MKNASSDLQAIIQVLRDATATQREDFCQRAEEVSVCQLRQQRSNLAQAGWDLNAVAPNPNSWNTSKKAYRTAKNLRSWYNQNFYPDPARKPASYTVQPPPPCYVIERAEAEPQTRRRARQEANQLFDAFLYKMAGKIGTPITRAALSGVIWDGCTVEVATATGETQIWTTKCILNQSVYGKLFNQWPTRRIN
jgi:hypothetical protein